ncbi:MAG: hypothetical protein ACC652_13805, partial [Acidimicrobiales bacterium]
MLGVLQPVVGVVWQFLELGEILSRHEGLIDVVIPIAQKMDFHVHVWKGEPIRFAGRPEILSNSRFCVLPLRIINVAFSPF